MNYNGIVYTCLNENGYKFDDVRIPLVGGWIEAEARYGSLSSILCGQSSSMKEHSIL